MDRSLDSIGSCSLDVDADSSDISDTSGSLNFPTPISVKDITREFTANIRERCTLRSPLQPQPQRTITTSAYVNLDPRTGGVRMVLSPPADEPTNHHSSSNSNNIIINSCDSGGGGGSGGNNAAVIVEAVEKKPSYLNLACCVNGYSNLTTYDSKIRQDINKSREVSPIRPSTSSLQYCKRNNSLAAPVLHTMPLTKQPATGKYATLIGEANNNNGSIKNGHGLENGDLAYCNGSGGIHHGNSTSSFIQQRVERLYGPGALAQGFYSPKKHSTSLSPVPRQPKQSHSGDELSRKFKQLSPSKDYGEFRKKLHNNCTQTATARSHSELAATTTLNGQNGDTDLPVFRHLSHEFRAQLPTVSPKRNVPRLSPAPEVLLPPLTNGSAKLEQPMDVVDHEPLKSAALPSNLESYKGTTKISDILEPLTVEAVVVDVTVVPATPVAEADADAAPAVAVEKDGNYFLKILKDEQARLLALAAVGEKYIDALTNNPDITEDTFGLLRSASGKARLLVSQKMKQFEGLCHNNLNRSPEDAFPTTLDDLQGFWDMVYLQVTHVDSIFADIEKLKANDWIRINEPPPKADTAPQKATKTTKTGNLKAKSTAAAAASAAGGGAGGASSKTAAASSAAALKREAQRKQLMEMKRQRREALAAAAAAKNQTACDGAAGDEAPIVVSINTNADVDADAVNPAAKIGDTVNIAVKNSS